MKKFLFYAVSLLLVLPAMAQTPADAPGTTTSTPPAEGLVIADGQVARLKKAPSFKIKGFEKYWKWVLSRVQYPADMEEQKVEGVVQVRIIVETDGSVTVDEVLASPHEKLTEAVTRGGREFSEVDSGHHDRQGVRSGLSRAGFLRSARGVQGASAKTGRSDHRTL